MNDAQHPYRTAPLSPETSGAESVLPRDEFDKQEWPLREQAVLTVDDYMKSVSASVGQPRSMRYAMLALAALLMYGAYRSGDVNTQYKWLFAIAAGTLVMLAVHPFRLAVRRGMKRQLQKMERDEEQVVYEFSPAELRIINQFQDIRIRWDSFKYWREVDGVLLAYWNAAGFQIFPISRFSTLGGSALRALLGPEKRVD